MSVSTRNFTTSDGAKLYSKRWEIESPKASIIVVHGYGEHCGRYDHVAEGWNEAGFSVYSYDHRGHGRSDGKMGLVSSFNTLIDDLHEFAEALWREEGHPAARFIFGHSMGGLVTAGYLIKYKPSVRGVVFSSALISMGNIPIHLRLLSPILSTLIPNAPVSTLEAASISRIPEEVEKYVSDPQVYTGAIPARTGHQFMAATNKVQAGLSEIALPFFAVHGTADRLVTPKSTKMLYEGASSEDKSMKLYEGAYHEVHNDLAREEYLRDITDWLLNHL